MFMNILALLFGFVLGITALILYLKCKQSSIISQKEEFDKHYNLGKELFEDNKIKKVMFGGLDMFENLNEEIKKEIIKKAVDKLDDPWKNLTVKDVAKDLKMGENKTNELFNRSDFPSVNIGKTKTVSAIAYALWKLDKRTEVNG